LDEIGHLFCPHAPKALRTARQTIGDALCACGLRPTAREDNQTCSDFKTKNAAHAATSFSKTTGILLLQTFVVIKTLATGPITPPVTQNQQKARHCP